MYEVTELFQTYAEALTRTLDFKLVSGEKIYTRRHFARVSIDEGIAAGDELEIGSCIAAQLDVTFLEGIDLPIGAELRPYLRFTDYEGENPSEWLPLGVFYVDSKPSTRQIGDYTCLDKMAQAEQEYITELLYPAPMQEVLIEALTQIGADTAYECVDTYMVNIEPVKYTVRDVLKHIASAHGGCARFGRDGLFTVVELHQEPVYTIRRKNYYTQTVERDPFVIQQLDIVVTDDLTITRGEAKPYTTVQWVNPWVTEEMADALADQLLGLEYHDMTLAMRGLPWLEPGDMVMVEDVLDPVNLFPVLIMRQKIAYAGGLSCTLDSYARSYNEGNFPRTSDLHKLVENKTKVLQEAVYRVENTSIQRLTDQLNGIIDISFSALVNTNPLFHASLPIVIEEPGVIEFEYILDNVPHYVKPRQSVTAGYHIIHLFLPLVDVAGNQGHHLQAFMRSDTARGYINAWQLQATVNGTGLATVAPTKPEGRVIEYVEPVAINLLTGITVMPITDQAAAATQMPIPGGTAEAVAPIAITLLNITVGSITEQPSYDFPPKLISIVNVGCNRIELTFDNPLSDQDISVNLDAFFLIAMESGVAKQYTKTAIILDPSDARVLYIDIDPAESICNADNGELEVEYRAHLGNLRSAEEGGMFVTSFAYKLEVV